MLIQKIKKHENNEKSVRECLTPDEVPKVPQINLSHIKQ